jgi:mannose-6-phosphate isomerase class I
LVFERRFFSNRQNGQRRLFVVEGAGEITPVSIAAEALELDGASLPRKLITVDDLVLSVIKYQGEAEEHHCQHGSELLLVHEDGLTLRTDLGTVTLGRGEMTVVPEGASYRVQAPEGALVLLVAKSRSEQG